MKSKFESIQEAAGQQPHGTRARYVGAKCKCLQCRAANSNYQTERDRARREDGDHRGLVPAKSAQIYMRLLSKKGIGYKTVAESAKVSINLAAKILSGKRTQIRAHISKRILSLNPSNIERGDGSLVPAAKTWKILNGLIERGYSRGQLAQWLGAKTPALQIKRSNITHRTEFKVEQLKQKIDAGIMRRNA